MKINQIKSNATKNIYLVEYSRVFYKKRTTKILQSSALSTKLITTSGDFFYKNTGKSRVLYKTSQKKLQVIKFKAGFKSKNNFIQYLVIKNLHIGCIANIKYLFNMTL